MAPGIYQPRGYNPAIGATSQPQAPGGANPPGRRDAPEAALLLAAGLALIFGIQLLRVFLPLATFHLHGALGLPPLVTAIVSLAVPALGLRAPALVRRMGWWNLLRWLAALLALTRIVEQLVGSPAADTRVALVGTALLSLLLPLLLLAASRDAVLRARLAFVTLLALAAETALRTLAGTLDLSWQTRPGALLAVLLPAAACLLAAILARRPAGPEPAPSARPWGWAALGAWLALYLLVLSNPAQLAARSGMTLERAGMVVLGGWLLGLLAVGVPAGLPGGPRARTTGAVALSAVGGLVALYGGDGAWLGILVAMPGMAVLLFELLAGRSAGVSRGIAPGAAAPAGLALLYLVYGRFDQPFGPSEPIVYLTAIGLLAAASLATAWRARREPPAPIGRIWLAGLVLAVAVAAVAPRRLAAPAAPPAAATAGPLRVMTFNLHQGFDVAGRLDPEGLAEVIELERPDLLALQEVARGWLVTGGLDLYAWLERRLALAGRFAGTADPQWGNAVLSRLPIRASAYHPLPPHDLPLRRGVLDVTVGTRRGDLRLLCLHLHHRKADEDVRVRQVEALLEIWGGTAGTILLGDFNALPSSPAIALLRRAGLRDAAELLAPAGRGTTAILDGRQIDWIFATPDLAFEATTMRYTRASDHLPLVTTVHLTTRFRGAAPPSAAAAGRKPPG